MVSKSQPKRLLVVLSCFLIGQGCVGNSGVTPSPLAPTITETKALTFTPAPSPASTEKAIPTIQQATSETTNNQLHLSQMDVDEWASTSPDGKWVVVGLVAFSKPNTDVQQAYVRLLVFSTDGKTHWTVIDRWEELGLGFPVPVPLKWSNDGKYFFFAYRVTPDGCPVFIYLTDLQKVDLESGSVQDLLPNPSVALALSPDDSQVAYSYFYGQPQMGLALRDLTTGKEQQTTIDPGQEFNAGNILWSPDGKSFVLTLAIHPCAGDHGGSKTVWAESTTILLVDAATLQQKVLVEEDPRLFVTHEWTEPEKITIVDGEENSLWHLDVNTREITRP